MKKIFFNIHNKHQHNILIIISIFSIFIHSLILYIPIYFGYSFNYIGNIIILKWVIFLKIFFVIGFYLIKWIYYLMIFKENNNYQNNNNQLFVYFLGVFKKIIFIL